MQSYPDNQTTALSFTCTQLFSPNNDNQNCPSPRYSSIAFIFKNKLYVVGGTTIPRNNFPLNALNQMFAYNLTEQQWQICPANACQSVQKLSSHCGTLAGLRYYIFGGIAHDSQQTTNHLWRLNLQTFQWNRVDPRGEQPSPRQAAHLLCWQRQWLILYGGINTSTLELYNTIHIFSTEARTWYPCNGNYIFLIYARFAPAMCTSNNKLYLFGGSYRNKANQEMFLNDFYQIDMILPKKTGQNQLRNAAVANAVRIVSGKVPSCRAGHTLVQLAQDYLLLVGGYCSSPQGLSLKTYNDIWLYSTNQLLWKQVSISGYSFKPVSSFASFAQNRSIYIFGGLHNYNDVSNQLLKIECDVTKLAEFTTMDVVNPCLACIKNQDNLATRSKGTSAKLIQDIVDQIEFPFSAFALLTDNSLIINSTFLYITRPPDGSFFRFEDNGKIPWSIQQFINSMLCFQSSISTLNTTQRSIKSSIIKQNARRQYCNNLKIGSLCLGTHFLLISFFANKQQHNQCLVMLLHKHQTTNSSQYLCSYYSFDVQSKTIINPQQNQAKDKIIEMYDLQINTAIENSHTIRNTLYVFGLRHSAEKFVLNSKILPNDITTGEPAMLIGLKKVDFYIEGSVDVSLRAYISSLYLNNRSMTISLSVNGLRLQQIDMQSSLQKIDRLCKQKLIIDISRMVQFDLKIGEIYFNHKLNYKHNFCNNGLLLYNKNRLITRYQDKIGELINKRYLQLSNNPNTVKIFGQLQIPDNVPVNVFKTDFVHDIMLQKLFCRIKQVEEFMTRKIDGLSKLKRYYPIKEKEERGSMGRTKEEILGIMSLSMKKSEDKVNDNVSKKDDDKFPDKGINIVQKRKQPIQIHQEIMLQDSQVKEID